MKRDYTYYFNHPKLAWYAARYGNPVRAIMLCEGEPPYRWAGFDNEADTYWHLIKSVKPKFQTLYYVLGSGHV